MNRSEPGRSPYQSNLLSGMAVALAAMVLAGCASTATTPTPAISPAARAEAGLARFIRTCTTIDCGFRFDPGARVDSSRLDLANGRLDVYLNEAFAQVPFREQMIDRMKARIRRELGDGFADVSLVLTALGRPVEELVPNAFRKVIPFDSSRRPPGDVSRQRSPLAVNVSKPFRPTKGLWGRHIAIWPSHGWYFERKLDRWEWQRARLFQTVEDLLPMAIVAPYLAPMLELAGAGVYLPRERDLQHNEAIVDNDSGEREDGETYLEGAGTAFAWAPVKNGFARQSAPLLDGENPFESGSARRTRTDSTISAQVVWVPAIPETGPYAVYVSYARLEDASPDAHYTVTHLGGQTEFLIDQRMGGATWIYLGTYRFAAGAHPESGQVALTNESSDPGHVLSADAVRFGGGMGSIRRGRGTSGRPRFAEGARYYMQFAGMPQSLVYNVTESPNDYVDDYRGRAEWVNYLRGAPYGPNKDRSEEGLHIPIDVSLAFHTDAGQTPDDSTIGTLMIYSRKGTDDADVFPDQMSRFANRDLGDMMQTQIVSDIRTLYDSTWTRRSIWDRDYSEAVRPNVPGVLLELLSHQNLADMKFGLDPSFRFDVARAVYKSILRFLASQDGLDFVVAPLPVDHMAATFASDGRVRLSWQPQTDPTESAAQAEGYIVYKRTADTGFDNGIYVRSPEFLADAPPIGMPISYRVTAVNAGGESFPSEILSVGRSAGGSQPVLIVSGFDRVSAPGTIEEGNWRGFSGIVDEGVPDRYDAGFVGEQYDFEVSSDWRDDDAPGLGASFATYETRVLPGNTFDYPFIHGQALLAAGRSFVSVSDEGVEEGDIDLSEYSVVDLILGEERTTLGPGTRRAARYQTFSPEMRSALETYTEAGGRLIVSGAYVGTDLRVTEDPDVARVFLSDVLGVRWRTDHASRGGEVYSPNDDLLPYSTPMRYNTLRTGGVYRVESPDAIEPSDSSSVTVLRYSDSNMSAAVGRMSGHRVVTLGFPFETLIEKKDRERLMWAMLYFLEK
jgi:hypothetical protein